MNDRKPPSDTRRIFEEFLEKSRLEGTLDPAGLFSKFPELEEELKELFHEFLASHGGDDEWKGFLDGSDEAPRRVGDFVITGELGRGAMGVVYEAKQITLNRRVALKLLSPHLTFSSEAIEKFRREAEAGGRQSHPGLVAVYAYGDFEGAHYIAQELVEGGVTLADEIARYRKRGEQPRGYYREAAQLAAELADALGHAHEVGVIHRDVKPSNILVTQEGYPKVTDFGLAKVEGALALSRSGELMGTPYYMSPEQAASKRIGIDKRTDVFSLGVTLYELLTLERPFPGDTAPEVLRNILLLEPVDPRKLSARIPRDLAVICLKAMEKLPDRRYRSMGEFSDDLHRFLQGEMILAKPAGPMTQVLRKVKGNPLKSTIAGLVVVTILFLGLVVPWIINLAQREYIDEVNRLSDAVYAARLEEDADTLWPAHPDMIPRMEQWLKQAATFTKDLAIHRETLTELRQEALPYTDEMKTEDRQTHPRFFEYIDAERKGSELRAAIGRSESDLASGTVEKDGLARAKKELRQLKRAAKEQQTLTDELERAISERRTWQFGDIRLAWRHDLMEDLIDRLELLADEESGLAGDVRRRIAFAGAVRKRSVEDARGDWEDAIASIADRDECPFYDGLEIEPRLGLVPIGQAPDSRLWEFAHLQTGSAPDRDPATGRLRVTEESGLVFVLLPRGTFSMGCTRPDDEHPAGSPCVHPDAAKDEGPVHAVTVEPFFLSKFEMTQGQWLRFTRENPSVFRPGETHGGHVHSLLHPVERVSWNDCAVVLSRLALRLPSEAEWEYAARAGSGTPWWTGGEVSSLADAANIADEYCRTHSFNSGWSYETRLNDGYSVPAPVGTYRPNRFGLHEITGNVWEWCRDSYFSTYEGAPSDGSARESALVAYRVYRGGGWALGAGCCRSSWRSWHLAVYENYDLGCRPALSLVPAE